MACPLAKDDYCHYYHQLLLLLSRESKHVMLLLNEWSWLLPGPGLFYWQSCPPAHMTTDIMAPSSISWPKVWRGRVPLDEIWGAIFRHSFNDTDFTLSLQSSFTRRNFYSWPREIVHLLMMTRRRARAGARSKGQFVVVVVDAVVVKKFLAKIPWNFCERSSWRPFHLIGDEDSDHISVVGGHAMAITIFLFFSTNFNDCLSFSWLAAAARSKLSILTIFGPPWHHSAAQIFHF